MKTALIIALLTLSAVASAQVDDYGRPVKQDAQSKAADPVKWQMQQQEGGWIHSPDRNPVKHKMRQQSWIHTEHKNPVKYEQQKRSWIHGSIHDD